VSAASRARTAAHALTEQVRHPGTPTDDTPAVSSLARGAAGIALLHIDNALTGAGTWETAHAWVRAATRAPVSAADDACLLTGAPALAFVLNAAHADGRHRYTDALDRLDTHVNALTHRRLDQAHSRIDRGVPCASFAEYDLFHGLTGIGAYLLHRNPRSGVLGRILDYLVRLTRPLLTPDGTLPGWWVDGPPTRNAAAHPAGGHANLGMAHGITGPLALLSRARRRGATVDGLDAAIHTVCTWLDDWRHGGEHGHGWPQWISRDEIHAGRPRPAGPVRPSWCYGTPGIARAQQVAGLALGDVRRSTAAESALAACLADPQLTTAVTGAGLCHGRAGLLQTARRAHAEATGVMRTACLDHLTDALTTAVSDGRGLLDGAAGAALALSSAARPAPPPSTWDAVLLID
jgi:hypothetical protein